MAKKSKRNKDKDKLEEEMDRLLQAATNKPPTNKPPRGEEEDAVIVDEVNFAPAPELKEAEEQQQAEVAPAVDAGVPSQTSTKFRHMLAERPNNTRKYLNQIPKYG